MTFYQVLRELQIVLAVILGTCPLCSQPVTIEGLQPPRPQPNKVLLAAYETTVAGPGALFALSRTRVGARECNRRREFAR